MYVQSSGFNEQDLAFNIPQLSVLAHQGYVVATVEYRPASEAPFPGQIDDVRAALEFLTQNAGQFAIDPARIALWGGSFLRAYVQPARCIHHILSELLTIWPGHGLIHGAGTRERAVTDHHEARLSRLAVTKEHHL